MSLLISAAHLLHDFQAVVFLALINLAVDPAEGLPVVDRSSFDSTQFGRHDLEIRIGFRHDSDHRCFVP